MGASPIRAEMEVVGLEDVVMGILGKMILL